MAAGNLRFTGIQIGNRRSEILTPDDIMSGLLPGDGPIMVYDDDQAYLGGVLADHLALGRSRGHLCHTGLDGFAVYGIDVGTDQSATQPFGKRRSPDRCPIPFPASRPGQATLQCVYTNENKSLNAPLSCW